MFWLYPVLWRIHPKSPEMFNISLFVNTKNSDESYISSARKKRRNNFTKILLDQRKRQKMYGSWCMKWGVIKFIS